MTTYWLSFADDEKNLGCVCTDAESAQEALFLITEKRLNPGGEVLVTEINDIPAKYKNRLMQKTEAEGVFGLNATPKDLTEQGYEIVHQECNEELQ